MPRRTRLSLAVAAIPVIAMTFAMPFVNRDEPHVIGLPFVFAWIIAWIVVTPAFMWVIHRVIEGRR
ncbi:MAG TPA: DUF3311 domain-containing protein [Candidatus Eremiobacteraceae bacterium]|nr:DUF3311 domain-containing protein [Candidatus Eremiobacteraceae bacterium]